MSDHNTDPLNQGGVKTEGGKTISSKNALKHGLLSREVLLRNEDGLLLEQLRTDVMEVLMPVGALEGFLADKIVSDMWRMRRALEVERRGAVVAQERVKHTYLGDSVYGSKIGLEAAIDSAHLTDADSEKITRYFTTIERSLFRTLHEFQRLQAARNGQEVPIPGVLDVTMSSPISGGE